MLEHLGTLGVDEALLVHGGEGMEWGQVSMSSLLLHPCPSIRDAPSSVALYVAEVPHGIHIA